MGNSSQKEQTASKTVTSEKVHVPSPRMHNFKDAKIQGGKRRIRPRTDGDVDVSEGEQHTQEEPSVTRGKEPKTSKTSNSVLSGPNKKTMDSVKDGPFRKHTASGSNAKLGPKRSSKAKHLIGSITCHLMILRHFRSTTKVTSSVTKSPTSSTSPMTRGNCQAGERHQSTMN